MSEQAYTLATYRVKPGQEQSFIDAWRELGATFSSLPHPPLWGTLIRHRTDRRLFYSFGPWRSPEHVSAMRESHEARTAFGKLGALCDEMTPGDYDVVLHIQVDHEDGR